MVRKCLMLAAFALLLPFSVYAQDSDWQALLYDGAAIHVLSDEGLVDTLAVPEGALNVLPSSGFPYMKISPDHRYLLFVTSQQSAEGVPPVAELNIADLEAQTCCVVVPSPLTDGPADVIAIGPFNPEGTQVAVLFSRVYASEISASVTTIDLASQTVAAQMSPMEAFPPFAPGVLFGQWTEDGIELHPSCIACEPPLEGRFSVWNPDIGDLLAEVKYFTLIGGALPATGEIITVTQNPNYPVGDELGMLPPANVVEYYPDGDPTSATVIYHDPANLNLAFPYWVMDGDAYLLHNWGQTEGTLVHRDGRVEQVTFPAETHVLVATPDGWVMQNDTAFELYYYHLTDSGLTMEALGRFMGSVTVVEAPLLGTSATQPITPVIN